MLEGSFFHELDHQQLQQTVDARTALVALGKVRHDLRAYRGSLFWRNINGADYLIRTTPKGEQKSLGPKTDENSLAVDRFNEEKAKLASRESKLAKAVKMHEKINRVLQVGQAPAILVKTLKAFRTAGLQDYFMVVGTHALYAYGAAVGVHFDVETRATLDVDFLYDTRRHAKFVAHMRASDQSLIGILRKVDKSFSLVDDRPYTAINDTGFEIDIVRRVANGTADPHPLRMSEDEDDFWAAQISLGETLLGAGRIEQVVFAVNGEMALMPTIRPDAFVKTKRVLSALPNRDPLKARKDRRQADVVESLIDEYWPQYAVGHDKDGEEATPTGRDRPRG